MESRTSIASSETSWTACGAAPKFARFSCHEHCEIRGHDRLVEVSMEALGSGDTAHEALEQGLGRALYRFDCPDAHTLGEYDLDLLAPTERTRVAAHTLECDDCRAELQILRA